MSRKRRHPQPATASLTSDDLRSALEQILILSKDGDKFRPSSKGRRELFLLWGITGHALAHSEAALELSQIEHLAVCAQANARVAYEHAALAQYAHLHPDGLEELEHLLNFGGYRLAKVVKRLAVDEEIRAFAEAQASQRVSEPNIARMEALLEKFDPTGQLYIPYRSFSQTVHPSGSTLVSYLDLGGDEGDVPLGLLTHQSIHDDFPLLWLATLSALLALGVREDLRHSKPHKSALQKIADSVGMKPLLGLSPDPIKS